MSRKLTTNPLKHIFGLETCCRARISTTLLNAMHHSTTSSRTNSHGALLSSIEVCGVFHAVVAGTRGPTVIRGGLLVRMALFYYPTHLVRCWLACSCSKAVACAVVVALDLRTISPRLATSSASPSTRCLTASAARSARETR